MNLQKQSKNYYALPTLKKKIVKKQFYLDISSKFHYSKNGKLHIDLTWNVEVGRLI